MVDGKDVESLVTVVTPAYNSENYISECIDSVINQTYKNWEMIIVNDCSTDNTEEIIRKYELKYPNIKLYNQSENGGAARARNKAIEMSEGRFIAFLDADDRWKPSKLQEQISFMLKKEYGFTFTAYETINMNKSDSKKVIKVPTSITYEQYLKNTIIGCLTVVMDKDILGEIKMELGELEDVLTWMKYLKKGHLAYGLNENLAIYRIAEDSVSSNKFKNASRYYRLLRKRQNLSIFKSVYSQMGYMFNAIKKRI